MQSAAMNMMFKNKNNVEKELDSTNRSYQRHFGKDITSKVLNDDTGKVCDSDVGRRMDTKKLSDLGKKK